MTNHAENKIPEEVKEKIIEYFLTNKNNTEKEIAEKFGVKTQQVTYVINGYFKNLKQCK